jgi:hypothetical protein
MNGTATCGERVIFVQVDDGNVNVKTGRVLDTDNNDIPATDGSAPIAWCKRHSELIEQSPDEAHESAVALGDVHLLTESEAERLKDLAATQRWFGSLYEDGLVLRINRALKRLKLS